MKKETPIVILLILLAVIIMGVCLSSCSPVRSVLSNPKKKEIVGREWEKEHPCTHREIFYPGKDSIVYDTTTITVYQIDTLVESGGAIVKYITKTKVVKQFIYRTDTILNEDTRRLTLAQKDISFRDGQISQLQEDNKQEHKRGSKWMWLFIVSVSLTAIGIFLKYRYKI